MSPLLPTLQRPVDIGGLWDWAVPPSNHPFLHQRPPHSKLELIDAGHFTWEENPDTSADIVTKWWVRGSCGRCRYPLGPASTAKLGDLAGQTNEEEPGVDDATDQARCNGRDHPIQPAARAGDDSDSRDADRHRSDRIRRESLDEANYTRFAGMTGTAIQDEQRRAGQDRQHDQLPADRNRWLRSYYDDGD